MDVAWIGNIYEKFEAMCLEMEEVMYEDTVKYVENQVQTVGARVKKFYADVLQDFDPDSYVDPVKVAAADLSLNPYAHSELKLKAKSKKDGRETDWKQSDDSKVISGKVSTGVHRRPTANRKGNSKGNSAPPLSASIATILESEDNVSSIVQSKRSREMPCSHVDAILPPPQFNGVTRNTNGKFSKPVVDTVLPKSRASVDSPTTALSAVGTDQQQTDSASTKGCSSAMATTINAAESAGLKVADDVPTSVDPVDISAVLSAATTGQKQADHTSRCSSGGLSSDPSDTCIRGGRVSQTEEAIYTETGNREDVIVAHQERLLDGCSTDEAKSNDVVDPPNVEIIEPFNESILEETCVVVEGERFRAIPQAKGYRKSYKKKLREAFSSRVRLTRKEYKRLAINYMEGEPVQESAEGSSPDCPADLSTKMLSAHSSESDWELL